MYKISKDFEFSASHCLRGVPEGHKCASLHGHNYLIRVVLKSLWIEDKTGFVKDYGDLKVVKEWIDENLDHSHLCFDNTESVLVKELMEKLGREDTKTFILGKNTSAEMLAVYLFSKFRELLRLDSNIQMDIWVSETPKTWATFSAILTHTEWDEESE